MLEETGMLDAMMLQADWEAVVEKGGSAFGLWRTSAEMDHAAAEVGCAVYRSAPNEILLDYDMPPRGSSTGVALAAAMNLIWAERAIDDLQEKVEVLERQIETLAR